MLPTENWDGTREALHFMLRSWSKDLSERFAIGVIGALVCGAFLSFSCEVQAQNDGAVPSEESVRVGVLAHFPPHYLTADRTGEPQGFAVDIFNAVARRAGLKPRYVVYATWPKLNTALQRREIDLIANRWFWTTRLRMIRRRTIGGDSAPTGGCEHDYRSTT